ncbi:hypothetical protein A1O7_02797 [Cladophialophora yegresii CBS 114405]|uniref:Nitrogen regulatory protein areA GATA-like domain-containing protein n=1 Tax=Cladophialophora yegresii CBS 114405 TaxID=1182544 RepID=W9W357_9EURO|nr:uncharacterized protein A1O7_02797 [Cladophialophora yegresii CBS 114405]EXJ62363.1 hypothetical protein A1O7_02797 [Cladophialophora yegresii CBS 114405]
MTAVLPQGLINANLDVQQYVLDDSNAAFTNSEALRKFWRVYAIQSNATQDDGAVRSRNLFWRIWSSRTLTQSITPPRLTRLWQRCSQEFDLTAIGGIPALRGPPTRQVGPTNGLVWSFQLMMMITQGPSAAWQSRNQLASLSPSSEVRPMHDSSPRGGQNVGMTLQDFRWSATDQTARGDVPRQPFRPSVEARGQRLDSSSGSTSQTTSESSSRPTLSRTASGGRQRLPVLANSGKARARPSVPRRKSSTQKSGGGSNQPKSVRQPTASSTAEALAPPGPSARVGRLPGGDPPPGLPLPPATSGPAFALPSASSWQSVDSISPHPPLASTAPIQSGTSGELVHRDFRGKFVETQKKLASSTNLTSLGRMRRPGSIVRFADELPQVDPDKSKEREQPTSPLREENLGPSRLRTSMASAAISDDTDSDSSSSPMELPRTKSQLSLLINNRRSETGSSDIGPAAQVQESKGKDNDARQKARSKEQELLSMGRRDGVTKAGGVQVPRQQRVSELEDPGYQSPSSPEPLF